MKSSRVVRNIYTVDKEYYELIKNEEGLKFSAVASHYLYNKDGSVSKTSIDRDSTMDNIYKPDKTSKELDEWLSGIDNIWNIYYRIECDWEIAEKLGLGEEYILVNVNDKNYLVRFDSYGKNIEYYTGRLNDRYMGSWDYAFSHPSLCGSEVFNLIKSLPRIYCKFEDALRSLRAMEELTGA